METPVLFSERQKFTQWWIWAILIGINLMMLGSIFVQVIGGEQFGDKPMSDNGLIVGTAISLLFTFLFGSVKLETRIKTDGIYVRFFPFHLRFKFYPWSSLKESYVRKYSPLSEFGGWGLRFGFLGGGMAYNVSGNYGLQLEFTDQKRLLIGTVKPEQLTKTLEESGNMNRNLSL